MTSRQQIQDLVFRAVDEVKSLLPRDQRLEKSVTTVLSGRGAALDSLGLMNLIVAVEQEIEAGLGLSLVLADEKALAQETNPFSTIETLIAYLGKAVLKESQHAT